MHTVETIDRERLRDTLFDLGRVGRDPQGGITRPFGSEAELAARRWLMAKMEEYGLLVTVDGAGNIWGRLVGERDDLAPLALGSHIDSVPHGGMYDGALGVLVALEVVRVVSRLRTPVRPLVVVAFTGEEPNPFGLSTLGSRAVAGALPKDAASRVAQDWGITVAQALRRAGAVGTLDDARIAPGGLAAYLEVHIEQGSRLERLGLPVGVVSGIAGIYRDIITLRGEPNHAGTTGMEERKDALVAAAEVILAAEGLKRLAPDLVATVGQLALSPNSVNIIPGEVRLAAELRAERRETLTAARSALRQAVAEVAEARQVTAQVQPLLSQDPVALDPQLRALLRASAQDVARDVPELFSMAGHDAVHVSRVAPAGMLFVRSLGGRSHCPDEESSLEDIALAAEILLRSVLRLTGTSCEEGSPLRPRSPTPSQEEAGA